MLPAAISARPAITIARVWMSPAWAAPERPAASAKGTVRPSDMPMTMSRTSALPVKCRSTCSVVGIRQSSGLLLVLVCGLRVGVQVFACETCDLLLARVTEALAGLLNGNPLGG